MMMNRVNGARWLYGLDEAAVEDKWLLRRSGGRNFYTCMDLSLRIIQVHYLAGTIKDVPFSEIKLQFLEAQANE
ncbi:hypothetical protein L2E82_17217 [Cichorium intybus]|uniref:Uncharacterized protein n=1 Tax=Cichorium intybus TaxID=13427 RepID=A0ACB9F8A5_CICIN|nr:hypothetical protein L2E82_17217 [Cichorium intybus]